MKFEQFDDLARAFVRGASRRQVLKALAVGALGGVLEKLGYAAERTTASDVSASKIYLPLITKVDPYLLDQTTVASLQAAAEALDKGALEVPISAQGTVRYRRTVQGGITIHEEMLVNGRVSFRWDHTTNQSVGQFDSDHDGFFERKVIFRTGSAPGDNQTERLEYVPKSTQVVRRWRSHQIDAATRRVIWEEAASDGSLKVVAEFETAVVQEFNDPAFPAGADNLNISRLISCPVDQLAVILNRFQEGVAQGSECLKKFGRDDLARTLEYIAVRRLFTIQCETGTDRVAAEDDNGYPARPIKIYVNTDKYFAPGVTAEQQRYAMFHELLHFPLGEHHPDTESYTRYDQVYACGALCFSADPDQCQCAACVKGSTCNMACQSLTPCKSGPTQCATACCVGPCEGGACCPPSRICNKLKEETAICCPPDQKCFNRPNGTSLCCTEGQICGQGSNQMICCPPGQSCGTNPDGSPACKSNSSKVYCNCNKTCYSDVGRCMSECRVSLGCFTGICGPADTTQCP